MNFFLCMQSHVFVDDFKIVPLCMTLGIQIIFEPQIILYIAHFCNFSQIAIFESGVENQYVLMIWNFQSVLQIPEVSLCLKPRKILEENFIVFSTEITLPYLLLKQVLLNFFDFTLCEYCVCMYLLRNGLAVVVLYFLASNQPRIRIINQYPSHFFAKLIFFRLLCSWRSLYL